MGKSVENLDASLGWHSLLDTLSMLAINSGIQNLSHWDVDWDYKTDRADNTGDARRTNVVFLVAAEPFSQGSDDPLRAKWIHGVSAA